MVQKIKKSLGIKSNYNFPITFTASMTRSLTDKEFKSIGNPKEWGILPIRPMGATIRMTKVKQKDFNQKYCRNLQSFSDVKIRFK